MRVMHVTIIVLPSGGVFDKPNGPALLAVALIAVNAKRKYRTAIIIELGIAIISRTKFASVCFFALVW